MGKDKNNFIPPNEARNYRNEASMSQSDIAFLLDIKNSGRISEWENGKSKPSIDHLFTLSLIFQRLPDQIYYCLRKELKEKLKKRYNLLRELKEKERRRDEAG